MGAGCTCGTSGEELTKSNVKSRSNTDKTKLLSEDGETESDQQIVNRCTGLSTAPLDGDAMAELVDAVDHGFTPMSTDATPFFPDAPQDSDQQKKQQDDQVQRESLIMAGIMSGSQPASVEACDVVASPTTTTGDGTGTDTAGQPTTKKRRSFVEELLDADSIAVIRSMDSSNQAQVGLISGSDSSSSGSSSGRASAILPEQKTGFKRSESEMKRLRTQTEAEVYYSTRAEEALAGEDGDSEDDEITEKMQVFQEVLKEQIKEVETSEGDSEEIEMKKTIIRQQSMYKWSTENMDEQKEEMTKQLLYLQAVAGGGEHDLAYVQKLMAEREARFAGSPPPASSSLSTSTGGTVGSGSIEEEEDESESDFASSSEADR